ncbi:hypothetical protein A2424_02035 [Candidatus Peribacteria bacterium RIFOXYC1_FULL_54_13]|nr:MAG: hypothetical protein A2198_02860 [Candidatus Peribacteria bacterium RIFOXYA1_FULL_56_14]OGJ74460.1 MAG: hypothetical protein A2217_01080 [Candidatus Peribacteria bacterium RIFOXYA2_FULL_55_28]OGJ75665.1 MAG: hypothetical protein A2384_03785 [Candidatus Peribacteria bacterium RIFOXYB1_FULL_54_35]OGJ76611.1 MAG: hypothetical protein A2327_02515 [Candidatus Peribacteria bacterium RIFOXYB2_FULL_54_17]OGJ76888.1 MAG: hypothetical protein A2424_02035 [Candidatus Peribacteria bacterium RIFOXYC
MQQTYTLLYGCAKYLFEQPEYRFFRSHIHEGMTMLDIGAHTGYYSRLFSSLVGPRGRVFSFEPDPWSFEVLRNHTRRRQNIQCVPSAAGDAIQQHRFYPNACNRANSSLFHMPFAEDPIVVEMTTVDSFCRTQQISNIDAMKIDVEGAETIVLRGAAELLATYPPAWIALELNLEGLLRGGSSAANLCTLLQSIGYELHSLSSCGKPMPIADHFAFIHGCTQGYVNIIAIRKHSPHSEDATLHCTCDCHVSAHK